MANEIDQSEDGTAALDDPTAQTPENFCGLIMPIAEWAGCSAEHWLEVQHILGDAVARVKTPRLKARLVSDADDAGIIHSRIVSNVYENPIVICDVSGRNPNVMFELGMRIAFDRKVVIVKDRDTPFGFDTGPIQHLEYPRGLRHPEIEQFKVDLAHKISKTLASDADANSYVRTFGKVPVFKPGEIDQTGVEMLAAMLRDIQSEIARGAMVRSTLPRIRTLPRVRLHEDRPDIEDYRFEVRSPSKELSASDLYKTAIALDVFLEIKSVIDPTRWQCAARAAPASFDQFVVALMSSWHLALHFEEGSPLPASWPRR